MLLNWLSENYVEVLGVIISLIYLYFSIRRIIWLWPFGILSSVIFIWIFFSTKFYADMGLQVYYLGISIYGWAYWLKGNAGSAEKGELPITCLSRRLFWILCGTGVSIFLGIVTILKLYTDSDVPWGDGFTTAASIIATWMLARKILEHWLVWIVVDSIAAALYFYKGLYPSAVLYVIYAAISVVGYRQWKKDIISNDA